MPPSPISRTLPVMTPWSVIRYISPRLTSSGMIHGRRIGLAFIMRPTNSAGTSSSPSGCYCCRALSFALFRSFALSGAGEDGRLPRHPGPDSHDPVGLPISHLSGGVVSNSMRDNPPRPHPSSRIFGPGTSATSRTALRRLHRCVWRRRRCRRDACRHLHRYAERPGATQRVITARRLQGRRQTAVRPPSRRCRGNQKAYADWPVCWARLATIAVAPRGRVRNSTAIAGSACWASARSADRL